MDRDYYLVRSGEESRAIEMTLDELKSAVRNTYQGMESEGYFAELLGKICVDGDDTIGTAGTDHELYFAQHLGRRGLYPVDQRILDYSESELFAVIEFLFDHASKANYKRMHAWDRCGYHFGDFTKIDGQSDFTEAINVSLKSYEKPHQLSVDGEIQRSPDEGLEDLFADAALADASPAICDKVTSAVRKYRRYSASADEQREAVRNLADALEFERGRIREEFSRADESALFNIANNFSIRHHNRSQQGDYPDQPWLEWIFVTYLNTIKTLQALNRDPVS